MNKKLTLKSTEFRKMREESWTKLDNIVSRVEEKNISVLTVKEVNELPLLYRNAVSSLSVARAIVIDRGLLRYLENLALRAYLVVYGPRVSISTVMVDFLRRGFPQAVRSMRRHILIIFVLMLVGIVSGYLLVDADIDNFNLIIPEDLAGGRGPSSTTQELIETELFAPWPGFIDTFIAFASFLFKHNTVVGIMCFCLGFALGLPTVILAIYNGLILGAFVALHAKHGLTIDCIGWLSIHGVTELLAIILCAAAGLVLAEKILFPDRMSRLESLALHGKRAASVAAGSVMLFFIAGILEGGFRQLINNTPGRYIVAILTALWWFHYFVNMGRDKQNL